MRSWQYGLASLLAVAVSSSAYAQLAPTNAQYAARPSDTGHAGTNDKGGYSAAIPFEFPEARGEAHRQSGRADGRGDDEGATHQP